MDILDEYASEKNEFILQNEGKQHLESIAKWGRFLAVVGYVFVGIMLFVSIILLIMAAKFGPYMGVLAAIYMIISMVYTIPINFLSKACSNLKVGLFKSNSSNFREGFRYFKLMYKFLGIFTVVLTALLILIFGYLISNLGTAPTIQYFNR
jgi:hypothetical protein